MLFDTHTHLQFKVFEPIIDEIIKRAQKAGVQKLIAVGTNITSSQQAIDLAEEFQGVYASVGIHPHHVFEHFHSQIDMREHVGQIELMLQNPLVLAIGEVGMDKHPYQRTKYTDYEITQAFISIQEDIFSRQIKLAQKYRKSLIIHNRLADEETLKILQQNWSEFFENRSVFHFCEAKETLLKFAKEHKVFIGVDGDITFDDKKQDFIKQIPLEMLVVETDSPFVTPSPLRVQNAINEPANLIYIVETLSRIFKVSAKEIEDITYQNSKTLFNLY
jgi:TatD DNase family protein